MFTLSFILHEILFALREPHPILFLGPVNAKSEPDPTDKNDTIYPLLTQIISDLTCRKEDCRRASPVDHRCPSPAGLGPPARQLW